MSEALMALERDKREIAESPDVFLVKPDWLPRGSDHAPRYAVQLPQDGDRFVLIQDYDGIEVMFKYRGVYRSLIRGVYKQTKSLKEDPAEYRYMSVYDFAKRYLLKLGSVRKTTWEEWRKRYAH